MAFEGLAEKLQSVFKRLRGKGKLTEADVEAALREVRLALLEADVHFKVVKDFIARVRQRAVGQEVLESLTPAQQVIKIVHDELTQLMGGQQARLDLGGAPPVPVMLVGLQGSGKTTTAAKLARLLARQGRQPLLVAADVYRPAAVEQLVTLGQQIQLPVHAPGTDRDPVDIAREGVAEARRRGRDVVIIDTAGRLHIDDALMEELERIRQAVAPREILLVVDAMTGQDAVNVAETFHRRLGIDGVVLTKLDGDARGGAALSVRAVTGRPIKFVGLGERVDQLEPFHPERMASRILGMGDVLSLIEKAQAAFDAQQAQRLERKLREQTFDLEDFLEQLRQVRKMGPLDQLLAMIPGLGPRLKDVTVDEGELRRIEAIIQSMTPEERRHPEIINASRRRRIARGSGTRVQDVNRLLKQFAETQRLMKQVTGAARRGRRGLGNLPFPR
ncbi:signal recognition particle subunit FFH/SRP54 (srp54) [Thermaerobacter marianensis DSM 12885]|uniref:Signal recognition particle protein n=1 Tax=Thermaerobacter marianensis (strain ATCC 700841 / DSM 12885 / JCM 10246 / 7p75a) TaxID=644966 RepID=E6SJE2_THEM7|nr:signal recognition particle protein [Thermaerobacter marianensis]ADU51070.1 signal recognition particle subunit FFH/SRP54 (srp54) [Thermaerobacter marianensis DSM 12885]